MSDQRNYPCIGDIVFTKADFAISKNTPLEMFFDFLNVAFQSILNRKITKINHVMVMIDEYHFLHTRPGAGFVVENWSDLWEGAEPQIFRHPNNKINNYNFTLDITNAILRSYNEKYDLFILRLYRIFQKKIMSQYYDNNSYGAFCSELIEKIYRSANMPISNKQYPLPVDLLNICRNRDWIDVTDIYIDAMNQPKDFIENKKNQLINTIINIAFMLNENKKYKYITSLRGKKIDKFVENQLNSMQKTVEKLNKHSKKVS